MDLHRHPLRRRYVGVLTVFVAVLALQVAVTAPVGAAPAGSINGTVVAPDSSPLVDVCVDAFDEDVDFLVGTRTDLDGTYRLEVPAGVAFRVQFRDCSDDPVHVEQWYSNVSDFDSAKSVTLDESAELFGLDATLGFGGSVSGTVTAPGVGPVGNICVVAVGGNGDSLRGVANKTTGPDGTYTLSGLPPGDVRVLFEDCDDVGPYLDQWYDGATTIGAATVIEVTEGLERTGVDATLQRAAVISGTVTGSDDQPLPEVCVQAVGDRRIGGSDKTDADGFYAMKIAVGGSYRVQFVDCDGDPTHAGRWFGGGSDPSTAQPVEVPASSTVKNISAQLDLGAGASLSGAVTNIRGDAMTAACAVLYLADEFVDFQPVAPDGSYGFAEFGSGTYAVAFVGCDEEDDSDAQMWISDPGDSGVAYQARWRGGAPLLLEDDDGPDPVEQGARLLTVTAGEAATVDECFGCGAIALRLAAGEDSVAATFAMTGLATSGSTSLAARGGGRDGAPAADGLDYSLSCRSDSPGVSSEPVAVAGVSSPLVATDLDANTGYTCSVTATRAGLLVADSAVLGVSTVASVTAPGGTSGPQGRPAGTSAGTSAGTRAPGVTATPRQLAFAG